MARLEISNIHRTFPNGGETLSVLSDVSFSVDHGATVAITGESGSGKSTLISVIAGLDRPDSGTVMIDDVPVTALPEEQLTAFRGAVIGLVFQFHYLLRDFSVLENVMLPAYMRGASKRDARDRARALLADVGLSKKGERLPAQLSGGERQRVACARALINEPAILLADEPTGNLDDRNSARVADLLFSLVSAREMTLVMVTHSEELASRTGRILSLEGGRIRDGV